MNREIETLTQIAIAEKAKQFRKAMESNGVSSECQDAICSQVNNFEDHVGATFELFRTPFLIKRYLEENFHLVLPRKVKLGRGEFQYVPVIKVLKKIVADQSFQKLRNSRVERRDLLADIQDGRHFQSLTFFKENPEALRLELFNLFLCHYKYKISHFQMLLLTFVF
jgi:hypothetical protein